MTSTLLRLAILAFALIWPAIVLAATFSFSPPTAQQGRPVTAKDISGKTVCWDDGWRITYETDGTSFGARGGAPAVNHHNSYWSLPEPGVVRRVRPGGEERYLQVTVLPDGRLAQDRFSDRRGMI